MSPLEYLTVLVTPQEHKQLFQWPLFRCLCFSSYLASVATGRCWITQGPKALGSLLRAILEEGNTYAKSTSIYWWTRVCLLIEVFVLRVCVFSHVVRCLFTFFPDVVLDVVVIVASVSRQHLKLETFPALFGCCCCPRYFRLLAQFASCLH